MNKIFNLHFTDYCNYACKFCYAKKEQKLLSLEQIKIIIDNISDYFNENNINDGRINIAGGEPMTCPYLQEIIDYIVSKKIKASIITNGTLLTKKFIENNKGKLSMIGISIDSINPETNITLGRCQGNKTIDYKNLCTMCNLIKLNGIILKINIVVSRINLNEDIRQLLIDVKPDRFKILQMLPTTPFAEKHSISTKEFESYLEKYKDFPHVKELTENIKKAYLIIDSMGNVSTENQHTDFRYNALTMKLSEIIDKIDFNFENEAKRYR